MDNKKNNWLQSKVHHRNVKKDAKFADVSKAQRLYGLESIWKVTIKIGLTGLLMSFFGSLFTFADQLMLVNFMPDTHNFSFNSLFFYDGHGVFAKTVGVPCKRHDAALHAEFVHKLVVVAYRGVVLVLTLATARYFSPDYSVFAVYYRNTFVYERLL